MIAAIATAATAVLLLFVALWAGAIAIFLAAALYLTVFGRRRVHAARADIDRRIAAAKAIRPADPDFEQHADQALALFDFERWERENGWAAR